VIQRIALVLIGGGALTALGFFFWWFFRVSFLNLGFRIAIAVVLVGILLLLVSAGWERYRAAKGKRIIHTFGLVSGSAVRTRHVGHDITASLRTIVGGEIPEYTQMMAQSREQAIQRMVEEAEKQGANAIVGVRFATSMVMSRAAEMMVYGTAVKVE